VLVRSELIRCASVPGLQIHGYPEAVNTLRRPPVARGACHGPRELDHLDTDPEFHAYTFCRDHFDAKRQSSDENAWLTMQNLWPC
jgi:hypothetical protein